MKQKLYVSGIAATLALVALIVALGLAASHALAPEPADVPTSGAAAPVVQGAVAFVPSENRDPAACGSPTANQADCTYY